jgi:hypothetical protein
METNMEHAGYFMLPMLKEKEEIHKDVWFIVSASEKIVTTSMPHLVLSMRSDDGRHITVTKCNSMLVGEGVVMRIIPNQFATIQYSFSEPMTVVIRKGIAHINRMLEDE